MIEKMTIQAGGFKDDRISNDLEFDVPVPIEFEREKGYILMKIRGVRWYQLEPRDLARMAEALCWESER